MQKCFENREAPFFALLQNCFLKGQSSGRAGSGCVFAFGAGYVCAGTAVAIVHVQKCPGLNLLSAPPQLFPMVWGNGWGLGCRVDRPLTRAGVPCMTLGKSLHLPKPLFPEMVPSSWIGHWED